jgi:hypothetical protein
MWVFEKRVLGKIFGSKEEEVKRAGGNCIMRAPRFVTRNK